jgi:hypothetical protein
MLRFCVPFGKKVALLLPLTLILAEAAHAQHPTQLMVFNAASRSTAREIHMAPNTATPVGPNMITNGGLAPGGKLSVQLPGEPCMQNIFVTFDGGFHEKYYQVSLCSNQVLVIGKQNINLK